MAKKYLVIDVETPNRNNDRISAIAATWVEGEAIQGAKFFLVNPEAEFDEFNTKLTGISPMDVVGAPTFPEVWKQISEDLAHSVIVAHNAPYDLSVLAKTCEAYGIIFEPPTYIDTVQMAKEAMPELKHHRLNDVCSALSLELDHHQADSDCAACAEVFLHCIRSGMDPDWYERIFRQSSGRSSRRVPIETQLEREQRCKETAAFLSPISYDGPIYLDGAVVCLSGEFTDYSKTEMSTMLEKKGAIVRKGVLKNTDYLFVGSKGNEHWVAGSYGRKIEKALELQQAGSEIEIVGECALLAALNSAQDAEAPAFQELLPVLESVSKRNFLPDGGVVLTSAGKYSSVTVHGSLVCRICWRKNKYISINGTPEQYPAVTAFQFEQKKSSPGFTDILLNDLTEIASLFPLLEQVAQNALDLIPKEYDCCSRFEQCSAARACIHPNPEFAKACGYRKKLAHGIVFAAGKE